MLSLWFDSHSRSLGGGYRLFPTALTRREQQTNSTQALVVFVGGSKNSLATSRALLTNNWADNLDEGSISVLYTLITAQPKSPGTR